MSSNTATYLDPCISGYGIVCGLEVHVKDDCSIEVQAGTAITPSGQVIHLDKIKRFNHYYLPGNNTSHLLESIKAQLKINNCYQLSEAVFNPQTMDSLKQQYQDDFPEHAFLHDKIVLMSVETNGICFWLAPLNELASGLGIQSTSLTIGRGLFAKAPTRKQVDPLEVDRYLRPVLSLPGIVLPRFGYKTLAITEKSKGFEGLIVNPFSQINSFQSIFSEYKAILDDSIPDFGDVLGLLHEKYSPLLTHKDAEYLARFPKILEAKWAEFCKKGEHLYYIQYFYDWMRDLVKAYEELRYALTDVRLHCICDEAGENPRSILLLGPVLGGRSSHQPVIFRDAFTSPYGQTNREAQLQHIKCLHWRMMMMIWTFDLPFLHLDKVLLRFGFDPGNEEKFDSTNYWESLEEIHTDGTKTQLENLPIKLTPTTTPYGALGRQAIPYYYPLDSDSPYSVHRYWDPHFTKVHRIDEHRSYNAHPGDTTKPITNTINDGYTSLEQTLYPLYFDLQEYPYMKVEGHIGKVVVPGSGTTLPELWRNNICMDVVAFPLAITGEIKLNCLEHQSALQPGQTLVLLYTNDEERIDLNDCSTDPVIAANTVVADFVLPYRYSCCAHSDSAKHDIQFKLKKVPAATTTPAATAIPVATASRKSSAGKKTGK